MLRLLLILASVFSLAAGAIYFLPTEPPPAHPTGTNTAVDLAYREAASNPRRSDNFTVPLSLEPVKLPPEKPRSQVQRMRINNIGVEAPLAKAGRDSKGVMDVPSDAKTVVWYDFTGQPGTGGNAVFAGHLDYHGVGPAVFWNLRKLRFGDSIEVSMTDGSVLRYQVVSTRSYTLQNAPVQDIIGPTTFDAITLITCGGTFDSSNRLYDERLVVRAQRVW